MGRSRAFRRPFQKERIRGQLQQRKREKNHSPIIAKKMGMMMNIVGSCIRN
jgi:hypothetical protein